MVQLKSPTKVVMDNLPLGVLITMTCGAVVAVWFFPSLALPVLAGICIVVATAFIPEYVLAAAIVLGLSGGDYAFLSSSGYLLGMASGVVAVYFLLPVGEAYRQLHHIVLPASIIVFVSIRYALENDYQSVVTALRCVAIVFLTFYAMFRGKSIVRAMGIACIAFTLMTGVVGDFDATGTRFIGISGNPNRMVYGILILLPFLLECLRLARPVVVRIFLVGIAVVDVYLLIISGSSQAVVGLLVLTVCLLLPAIMNSPLFVRILLSVSGILITVFALMTFDFKQYIDNDLATLSGRTQFFGVAWDEFLNNALFGTGERHVSGSLIVERSAHSSLLGLFAAGGLLVGLPWLVMLVKVLMSGFRQLLQVNIVGAASVLFVVEQFVQSVEYVLITWFIITYAVLSTSAMTKSSSVSHLPRKTLVEVSSRRIGS